MHWPCRRVNWVRYGKFLLWYMFCIVFIENMLIFLHFNGLYSMQGREEPPKKWETRGISQRDVNQTLISHKPTKLASSNRSSETRLNLSEGMLLQKAVNNLVNISRPNIPKPKELKVPANKAIFRPTPRRGPLKPARQKPIPTNDPELEKKYFKKTDHVVSPFNHTYIMSPSDVCDSQTFLMIIVHSFHPYADKRLAIRQTWGRVATGKGWPKQEIRDKIKLVFMLGTHKQSGYNDKIRDESEVYNDIVQGDFIDDYKNMTLKSLLGLKWMKEQCPTAKFLLKSDDDMFINIPYLLQILQSRPFNWTIMGPLNRGSRVYRTGKWKVTKEQYPFYSYPQYEAGSAYVFTRDLIEPLYDTAQYVPPIHVDDVYITGIIGRILNVTHAIQRGFAYWTDKPPTVCDILNNRKISGTKMNPSRLVQLWKEIEQGVCREVPEKKRS